MLEGRVQNPLPIPEQCDACASLDIVFTGNERVYGKPFGEWPYVYYCQACGAVVGCHPNTHIPLGRMADKKTRIMRGTAHKAFDPLWQSGAISRSEAYELLARHLGITREECHISQLNMEQLKATVEYCNKVTQQNHLSNLKRRKEKKNAKLIKRTERERKQKFYGGKRVENGANPFFRRSRRSKPTCRED